MITIQYNLQNYCISQFCFFFSTRTEKAWYWQLIDDGQVPNSKWTIWSEIVQKEVADVKVDQARGITEEEDEQSETLKRIRKFQEIMETNNIDKSKFDKFGVEVQ